MNKRFALMFTVDTNSNQLKHIDCNGDVFKPLQSLIQCCKCKIFLSLDKKVIDKIKLKWKRYIGPDEHCVELYLKVSD